MTPESKTSGALRISTTSIIIRIFSNEIRNTPRSNLRLLRLLKLNSRGVAASCYKEPVSRSKTIRLYCGSGSECGHFLLEALEYYPNICIGDQGYRINPIEKMEWTRTLGSTYYIISISRRAPRILTMVRACGKRYSTMADEALWPLSLNDWIVQTNRDL